MATAFVAPVKAPAVRAHAQTLHQAKGAIAGTTPQQQTHATGHRLSTVGLSLAAASGVAAVAGSRRRYNKQARKTPVSLKAVASSDEFVMDEVPPAMVLEADDPSAYTVAILGDLHIDPRDLDHTFEGREHMKKALDESATSNKFLVSLGDLGESKDCTETKQLFSGTTPCFQLAREILDGFGVPFDVVGGNHDLEGIDEFGTDEENLAAYLKYLGKETPQFCHEIAEKVVLIGLGSTAFRTSEFTSHEVTIDAVQLKWFEDTIKNYPASEGYQVFCFSHAPIIGSAVRVLQTNHVVNGCCWLNHSDAVASKKFIQVVRENSSIKAWFNGHFHLSHDYEDSITFPGGNNRGSAVFCQTGCMTARSSRDGRRHSRFLRGNSDGFEICTIDHMNGGRVRLDATVTFAEMCEVPENLEDMAAFEDGEIRECSTIIHAHKHADFDHDAWFQAYVPEDDDGNYVANPDGTLNTKESGKDYGDFDEVSWWHMKDGAVLGCHNGMVIEYDPSTLAPLGMVVSRDELANKRVAVIDDEWGGSALVLYDDLTDDGTVVQPNEDGSYWRKVVRNKMHRMQEMRRVAAAKNWLKQLKGVPEVDVLSSYGPYTTTAGQVMGISTKAVDSKKLAKEQEARLNAP